MRRVRSVQSSHYHGESSSSQVRQDTEPRSSRFSAVYGSLPSDAQNLLVEKHLIPLLDLVAKRRSKKVITSASKLQRRHAGIPKLDQMANAKKAEIKHLLDELQKDAKRAFIKDRSFKGDVLTEIVNSLTDWLNDIWSVVYEHNVGFWHAHKCLLCVVSTLEAVEHERSGCKCAFVDMYVPIVLKRKSGQRVKSFEINGAHNIEEALLFIWRDLFLSLLAYGGKRQIAKIPEMLEEIEDLVGWASLERLLYGGRKCPHDFDEDEEEVSDYIEEEVEELARPASSAFYAKHWSYRIYNQMWELRKHIQAALTVIFRTNPSLRLYSSLLVVSPDPGTTQLELMHHLDAIALSCSDTYVAALDIHALENHMSTIASMLRSHSHLLRPRDAPALQTAVSVVSSHALHHPLALEIIENELLDTVRSIRAATLVSFSRLDEPANKEEIQKILRLRSSSDGRQDRIEHYVDAIATPGTNTPNPMAFAAMMMGLPLVPGMDPAEDADPLGYLDLDPHDPDFEDLREEFRPRLKHRFESWVDTATLVKGGPAVLIRVYNEVVVMMPLLRVSDIVEDMLGRLADKPSKHHVCDGLDALSAFVKVQRRKAQAAKNDANRRKHASTSTQAGSSSFSGQTIPPRPPVTSFAKNGDMEDVD